MRIVAIVLLLAAPALVWAQPSVNSVSGLVAHGDTVTVFGSDFGAKSPAAPLKWEEFDPAGAVDGGRLSTTQTEWLDPDEDGQGGAFYKDDFAHSGTYSVSSWVPPWEDDEAFRTNHIVVEPSDELFVSYWFRYQGGTTSDYAMNIKMTRINSKSAAGHWYNGLGCTTFNNLSMNESDPGAHAVYENGEGTHNVRTPAGSTLLANCSPNRWTRVDSYKRLSTPGVANGQVFSWNVENKDYDLNRGDLETRASGDSFQLDCISLGLMWANQYTTTVNFALYIDDVYIDNTLARVELGDDQDFFNCTHREMQLPLSWESDGTQLQVRINQGTLPDGEAWLFVVDADGNPSAGKRVVLGQESEAPPVPIENDWRIGLN